jgi:hypothetical protein
VVGGISDLHIQFFDLYEVVGGISDLHIQFFDLYEVGSVDHIRKDARRA